MNFQPKSTKPLYKYWNYKEKITKVVNNANIIVPSNRRKNIPNQDQGKRNENSCLCVIGLVHKFLIFISCNLKYAIIPPLIRVRLVVFRGGSIPPLTHCRTGETNQVFGSAIKGMYKWENWLPVMGWQVVLLSFFDNCKFRHLLLAFKCYWIKIFINT